MPLGRRVSRLKAERRIGTARAPNLAKDRVNALAWNSILSTSSAMRGLVSKDGFASAEGGIQGVLLISPAKKVSPVSTAVTAATAGLNSIGSIL